MSDAEHTTEQTDADETTQIDEASRDAPTDVSETDADDGDDGPSGREARYRRRLRETEAERDRLTAQNTALRRAMAEQAISAEGVKPQAIWAVAELSSLCGDDGLPDPVKIRAAVQTARETLGVQPATGLYVSAEGPSPTMSALPGRSKWDNAFKSDRR